MEKIVGIDLEKWMQHRGMSPIDQDLMMQWLRELVTILDQVHTQKFFHRDIKPPNIMLNANGRLSLIDFGTVREITETYQVKVGAVGNVTGIVSAGYTPPEQINYHAEPRSDFFALGRTFVYLLTGKHPLDQDIYDPRSDELRWSSQAPNISPLIVDLLDDMMAHKPTERPDNTQAILQRINQIEASLQTGIYVHKFPRFRPGMEFPKTEAKFLRQWTLVTATGFTIGSFLALFLLYLSALFPYFNNFHGLFLTIMMSFILGSAYGVLQWLVLKKWLYQIRWWIFANGIDAAVNSFIIWLIIAILSTGNSNIPVLFIYCPFTFIPFIQYLRIRKSIQIPFAFFWFLTNSVSWIVGLILGLIVSLIVAAFPSILESPVKDILFVLAFIIILFLTFACIGLLTGMALVSLLKSPRQINNR
jgi:Protein kinase domain